MDNVQRSCVVGEWRPHAARRRCRRARQRHGRRIGSSGSVSSACAPHRQLCYAAVTSATQYPQAPRAHAWTGARRRRGGTPLTRGVCVRRSGSGFARSGGGGGRQHSAAHCLAQRLDLRCQPRKLGTVPTQERRTEREREREKKLATGGDVHASGIGNNHTRTRSVAPLHVQSPPPRAHPRRAPAPPRRLPLRAPCAAPRPARPCRPHAPRCALHALPPPWRQPSLRRWRPRAPRR
jgi:hypothetical protein